MMEGRKEGRRKERKERDVRAYEIGRRRRRRRRKKRENEGKSVCEEKRLMHFWGT